MAEYNVTLNAFQHFEIMSSLVESAKSFTRFILEDQSVINDELSDPFVVFCSRENVESFTAHLRCIVSTFEALGYKNWSDFFSDFDADLILKIIGGQY